jgi:hypothetical protein
MGGPAAGDPNELSERALRSVSPIKLSDPTLRSNIQRRAALVLDVAGGQPPLLEVLLVIILSLVEGGLGNDLGYDRLVEAA